MGKHLLNPVTFRLPIEMKQALRGHADRLGTDYSVLVRAIITRWLHEQNVKKVAHSVETLGYTEGSPTEETT